MNGHTEHSNGLRNGNGAIQNPITCWLIDTRKIWRGDNIWAAEGAAAVLALISTAEQNVVTTKMFIADARMSLASALLKRLYVSKTLGIPWSDVRFGRKGSAKHGKPAALDKEGSVIEDIDFNVSHQAGLVTLIGADRRKSRKEQPVLTSPSGTNSSREGHGVTVGVDIVCVNERDDYRTIDEEGLDGWIDIYDSIFSEEERWSMKYDCDYVTLLDGTIVDHHDLGRHDRCLERDRVLEITTRTGQKHTMNSELIIDAKLRRFYTYFCYKEAYIKLAGEGLLANWIKRLEFINVRSPKPGTVARCSTHGVWGEIVDDVEVHLHGHPVENVKMQIQAFEENLMISTAVQGEGLTGVEIPAFSDIDPEKDIMAFATAQVLSPT